jgi:hypothetical protein
MENPSTNTPNPSEQPKGNAPERKAGMFDLPSIAEELKQKGFEKKKVVERLQKQDEQKKAGVIATIRQALLDMSSKLQESERPQKQGAVEAAPAIEPEDVDKAFAEYVAPDEFRTETNVKQHKEGKRHDVPKRASNEQPPANVSN